MTRVVQIDGLPVVDAKRPLRLSITKADIAKAGSSIKDPSQCAVARACYRDLHVKEARIHLGMIYLRTNDHNWIRYKTPPTLRSEIIAFDRGGSFEPGEVVLRPRSMREQTSHSKGGASKPNRGLRRGYTVVKNVRAGPA